MSQQEQPATSLEKAQYWLDSFKKIDLSRFQRQLKNAADHAKEQAANQDLPESNRAQYAQEAAKLTDVVTELALAQDQLELAQATFIASFGDTADPDWWLFTDDLLE